MSNARLRKEESEALCPLLAVVIENILWIVKMSRNFGMCDYEGTSRRAPFCLYKKPDHDAVSIASRVRWDTVPWRSSCRYIAEDGYCGMNEVWKVSHSFAR